MKVENPKALFGNEVYDMYGKVIGKIDKIWESWNKDYPGYFFGFKTYENTRDNYFRGTNKLIPIYSDYLREVVNNHVTLNKTIDDLSHLWNKIVQCGHSIYPLDQLFEMSVYDKYQSRVGTLCSFVEIDGMMTHFGLLLDPYLYEYWNVPYNTILPIETSYIKYVKDTINLDKTLDELKIYWHDKYHVL